MLVQTYKHTQKMILKLVVRHQAIVNEKKVEATIKIFPLISKHLLLLLATCYRRQSSFSFGYSLYYSMLIDNDVLIMSAYPVVIRLSTMKFEMFVI